MMCETCRNALELKLCKIPTIGTQSENQTLPTGNISLGSPIALAFGCFTAISLHLGNGSSAAAIQKGKSVDTSMGLTPLEGLIMGTRCGDIDPTVVEYTAQCANKSLEEVMKMLNHESGLKGICGDNEKRRSQKRKRR